MGESKVDLLLAKRRILALLPFSLITFGLSIIMVVFSAIATYKLNKIRDDYTIERDMFKFKYDYINNYMDNSLSENEQFCKDTIKTIGAINNFTIIFELNQVKNNLNKVIIYAEANLGFSIVTQSFTTPFLIIMGFCSCAYISSSDNKIRANPAHIPNKKHWVTTCLIIFKILSSSLIYIFLIIYALISNLANPNLFDGIYKFHQNCVLENDKTKFKNKFIYCWNVYDTLTKYLIFVFLFIILDIISLVLVIFSKKYNIWSFILNKISGGKFKYKEVDDSKGFIIPQNKVLEDNKLIDDSSEVHEEIVGAINESEDSILDQNNI